MPAETVQRQDRGNGLGASGPGTASSPPCTGSDEKERASLDSGPEARKPSITISFAERDSGCAFAIAADFRNSGLWVDFDTGSFPRPPVGRSAQGSTWDRYLSAECTLVLLSRDYLATTWSDDPRRSAYCEKFAGDREDFIVYAFGSDPSLAGLPGKAISASEVERAQVVQHVLDQLSQKQIYGLAAMYCTS